MSGSGDVQYSLPASWRSWRPTLAALVRAGEWWEYKLAPIYAMFYATALTLDVPVSALWREALTLLVALVPGAAYVSVINDLTDRDDDRRAGKPNRLLDRARRYPAILITITAGAGLALSVWWRHDTLLLSLYLAAWLSFSLYSLPPFRWKARGVLGVLADASGAHLFPTLVAVVLAYRGAGRPVNAAWLASVGAWAAGYGVRGILWHQLTDLAHDRRARVGTFAERHRPELIAGLGTFVVFPIELAALTSILWQMGSAVPLAFLAAYAGLVAWRVVSWRMNVVVVASRPRFLIVLHEYYDAFLPLAVLTASALRYSSDLAVLVIHLLVFPRRPWQAVVDLRHLVIERLYRSWR